MVSKSSLIGFGAGALLAGGITYFSLNRDAAPAPVVAQSAPLVESSSTLVEPAPAPDQPAPAPRNAFTTSAPAAPKVRAAKPARVVREEPVAVPAPAPAPAAAPEPPKVSEPAAPKPVPTVAAAEAPAPRKAVPPPPPPPPNQVTVASGTTLSVRLNETLASNETQQGHKFQATLDQPLVVGEFVIAERGARVEGRVVTTEESGRVKGLASMTLELTHLKTSDGQRIPITTASFEKIGEKETKSDATKVAVGAGVGAALGAIFGGGKGAAIGTAAGAGAGAGTVLATRGKPVVLPAETRLTFALKGPVTITERR